MYFKKGFYYKGYLFGWNKKSLYRIYKEDNLGLPLRKCKLIPINSTEITNDKNKKGYKVGKDKKTINQLLKITTDINYTYEIVKHKDVPF